MNVGFESLVAHNDELLPPGTGYADHPHTDLEIVTWVLSGALRHTSTVGLRRDRSRAGAAALGRQRSGALRDGRERRGDPVPAGLGAAGRARSACPTTCLADAVIGEEWTCVADGDGRGVVPIAARGTSLQVAVLGAGQRIELARVAPRCTCSWQPGRCFSVSESWCPVTPRACWTRAVGASRPRRTANWSSGALHAPWTVRESQNPSARSLTPHWTSGVLGDEHPGVEHAGRVELAAFNARSIRTPTGPISAGQPRLVVLADGVVMGDRGAVVDHRVATPPPSPPATGRPGRPSAWRRR